MVNRQVQLTVQGLRTKFKKKKKRECQKVCLGQCEGGLRPEETSSWLTVLRYLCLAYRGSYCVARKY